MDHCPTKKIQEFGIELDRAFETLGVKGEAKRNHGLRTISITGLAKDNPLLAQQITGHSDILTIHPGHVDQTEQELRDASNKRTKQVKIPV